MLMQRIETQYAEHRRCRASSCCVCLSGLRSSRLSANASDSDAPSLKVKEAADRLETGRLCHMDDYPFACAVTLQRCDANLHSHVQRGAVTVHFKCSKVHCQLLPHGHDRRCLYLIIVPSLMEGNEEEVASKLQVPLVPLHIVHDDDEEDDEASRGLLRNPPSPSPRAWPIYHVSADDTP